MQRGRIRELADPLVLDEFPPMYTILDLYEDGTTHHEYVYYNTLL